MTVSNTESRKTYVGDGATTSFATNPVVFFDDVDLTVYVVTTATGVVAATLTLGTHYTVSGGDGATGTVNLAGGSSPYGAPTALQTLVIVRELDITQGADFVNNDASDAEVAEDALDRLTMICQELDERIDRSMRFADSDVSGASTTLPTPSASALIGWNGGANALQNYSTSTLGLALTTAFTLTLLDDPDAEEFIQTLMAAATALTAPDKADKAFVTDTSASNIGRSITLEDLWKVIATFTALTDVDRDSDTLAVYDASAGAVRAVAPKATRVVVPVRQTVLSSALDSNGYAAGITTGSGLLPGLDASPTPMTLAFAAGFDAYGAIDYAAQLIADASTIGSALPASNTSFLHATYSSPTAVTWGSALVPPQYGYAFDRAKGALLNFEGADASTTMLDDFGNTWTASGNAQIDTAQAKFGTSSLLLDGTGDYISSSNYTSLGDGSWQIECWFRLAALPGVGAFQIMFNGHASGAGWGVQVGLNNNAGTTRLAVWLSSDGSSWNLANNGAGTNTVWALNQWNKVRLVFDALAGTYKAFLSLNGAAETTDYTLASTARICAISAMRVGATWDASSGFNGWLDAFRFLPCATNTSTETPSASAPTITDYPVHFFSIPEMKMYEVTAASVSAGTNPTLTQRNRVFVAEADTGAATVSAVRNYAIRGKYFSQPLAGVAANTSFSFQHNLGVPRECYEVRLLGRSTVLHQSGRWSPTYRHHSTLFSLDAERGDNGISVASRRNFYYAQTADQGVIFDGSSYTTNYQLALRAERTW